jgi:hypothetical protein
MNAVAMAETTRNGMNMEILSGLVGMKSKSAQVRRT